MLLFRRSTMSDRVLTASDDPVNLRLSLGETHEASNFRLVCGRAASVPSCLSLWSRRALVTTCGGLKREMPRDEPLIPVIQQLAAARTQQPGPVLDIPCKMVNEPSKYLRPLINVRFQSGD